MILAPTIAKDDLARFRQKSSARRAWDRTASFRGMGESDLTVPAQYITALCLRGLILRWAPEKIEVLIRMWSEKHSIPLAGLLELLPASLLRGAEYAAGYVAKQDRLSAARAARRSLRPRRLILEYVIANPAAEHTALGLHAVLHIPIPTISKTLARMADHYGELDRIRYGTYALSRPTGESPEAVVETPLTIDQLRRKLKGLEQLKEDAFEHNDFVESTLTYLNFTPRHFYGSTAQWRHALDAVCNHGAPMALPDLRFRSISKIDERIGVVEDQIDALSDLGCEEESYLAHQLTAPVEDISIPF